MHISTSPQQVLQDHEPPNIHQHTQRAAKEGAVERACLLALLGGFCSLCLLRTAELMRSGESEDDREIDAGRHDPLYGWGRRR